MGRGQTQSTKQDKLHISRIIDNELMDYLPVTVRQVFYKMVKDLIIENSRNQYRRVSKLMTQMRYDGELEWWKVTDRSRRVVDTKRWPNLLEFYKQKIKEFDYYLRCKVQQQDNYIEVWSEKDTLAEMFKRVTLPHCVKLVIVRGQSSTTFVKEYAERARQALEEKGQEPVIIYGGDLDPSGIQIPISIEDRLREKHDLDVTLHRFGLTPEQVEEYNLPTSIEALKPKDPNTPRFIEKFGTTAVELDALDPPVLEFLIEDALGQYLDMESFEAEREVEKIEQRKHRQILGKVNDLIEHELRSI